MTYEQAVAEAVCTIETFGWNYPSGMSVEVYRWEDTPDTWCSIHEPALQELAEGNHVFVRKHPLTVDWRVGDGVVSGMRRLTDDEINECLALAAGQNG